MSRICHPVLFACRLDKMSVHWIKIVRLRNTGRNIEPECNSALVDDFGRRYDIDVSTFVIARGAHHTGVRHAGHESKNKHRPELARRGMGL